MANEFKVKNGIKFPDDTIQTTAATGGGSATLTISNKTSAYTVVAGDLGTIINCTSGTFTVSLTAAATLGAGFNCWIWNTSTTSTDVVAIDPTGSETIDGVQTISLRAGEGTQIVCDGTSWITGDKKAMRGYAENIVTTSRPVATGSDSVALGSSYTSGGHSFAAAISNNTSTYGAKAYGGIAIGSLATVTGTWGAVLGGYNNAVKDTKSAVIGGESNDTADTGWSVILGGKGTKPNQNSKISAGMFFSSVGDNQWGRMASFKAITTDATPKDLRWDNESYFNTRNIQALQTGELRAFRGFIVAKVSNTAGNDCKVWEVTGACKRGSTYGSAAFVGTPSVNVIAYDNGASSWTIAPTIIVNNGADGFTFTFTGEAGKTIRIAGYIDTMELGYLS